MRHALDLTRYAFKRELGDLTLFGTWLYNNDQEDTEPAIVIIPRYRALNGAKPICIALSSAFKYNDPRYLAHAAAGFSRLLGFEDSMTTTHKLASVIHDHLLDLIKMPLEPTEAVVTGEASVNLGNGVNKTVEFVDHAPKPQV